MQSTWIRFEIRSTAAGRWEASGSRMRLNVRWLAQRVRPSEVGPYAQHHPAKRETKLGKSYTDPIYLYLVLVRKPMKRSPGGGRARFSRGEELREKMRCGAF